MKEILVLSPLAKTWLIDIDGTILRHNGHLTTEEVLLGVKEFFTSIPKEDVIILLTARETEFIEKTKKFLDENGLRYNYVLSDLPWGERIIINDIKPSGLKTAYAINKVRDAAMEIEVKIDNTL